MFPPFDTKEAHRHLMELISALDGGALILKRQTKESLERKGQGLMLGCLCCKDSAGNDFQLFAVSGISEQLEDENHWLKENQFIVPPLVSPTQITEALSKNDEAIHKLTEEILALKEKTSRGDRPLSDSGDRPLEVEIEKLIHKRTVLTTESLEKVFNLYNFYRFDGKKISLQEIIKSHGNKLPPTGTGECCAPKLLSYAFEHNLQPISMDEVYYGKDTKNKINGHSYGPCDERCGYILPFILGLEILYRDENILVVNKQSGVLSVPGRTEDKKDCIVTRMQRLFPDTIVQPSVHRLDMETSGLLVLAFDKESHKNLNAQFAEGKVHKKYVALLEGVLNKAPGELAPKNGETSGRIELKFRLDPDNRPHQIYDSEFGKTGITIWESKGIQNYYFYDAEENKKFFPSTRIIFTPETGRTHQLRLHSSDIHGLGLPIIGDTLYGHWEPGQRLMLHAFELEFFHPRTGELLHFNCPPEF